MRELPTSPPILGTPELDPLRGRRFSLVPLTPVFHRELYQLCVTDQNAFRWRFPGILPSLEAFERSLHASVLSQFVIVASGNSDQMLGLVVAYNANLQSDYCFLAAITSRAAGAGTLEGVALFLRYLVRHWPFRKIYLEALEYNASQFQSAVAAGLLHEEGRLKDHQYFLNRYWDLITYAIYLDGLLEFGERLASIFEPAITE